MYVYCIVLVITAGLWGCAHENTQEKEIELISHQADGVQSSDYSMVPQTLAPPPSSQPTESASPEQVASLPRPEEPKTADSNVQHTVASTVPSTTTQPTKKTSTTREGKVFGEFTGVKTKWADMKQQLADQIREQQQQTKELEVKLQLIEQIAEHVNFTIKAYVANPNVFLAEFTIENRTPYSIKDISITCDQIAPTGTIIQSHAETVYDIIKPTTGSTYSPFPLEPSTDKPNRFNAKSPISRFIIHHHK